MSLAIQKYNPVPLKEDADGIVRVGRTRVSLDIVVDAFAEGATAEEIVIRYPVLRLADVYSVIAYYLHHRSEVDDYVNKEQELDQQARLEVEARSDLSDIRERLLARLAEKGR
jgi:uncharacterized protein (DUF433 family)